MNATLLDLFKRFSVWDYSTDNVLELKKLGVNVESLLPICYEKHLTRIEKAKEQDIDVLFIGSLNPRRADNSRGDDAIGLKGNSSFRLVRKKS